MWWCRAALAGFAALAQALAACDYRPVYGEIGLLAEPGAARAAAVRLDEVKIVPIADRRGQILHNALLDRINPAGEPASPRYTLTVRLEETVRAVDTRRDSTITRNDIVLAARYDLRDAESDVIVFRQRSEAVSSYNLATQRFASVVSEDDARRRAAHLLADEIALSVALYIRRRHAAAPARP
jgi:LPS-assembly lipoprotein